MRRALAIVGAVTGYAVTETLLLLSVILPHNGYSAGIYQWAVLWAQFLLIPGFAALFSRIIYGRRKWGRRTSVILLVAPLGLSILITPFAVLAILLDWTFVVSRILLGAAMSVVFVGMVMGFRWCMRRSRTWSAESEADRWLAEKRGQGIDERKWRSRGVRVASVMPVVSVLLVFLFLPEVWGILSHLDNRRLGSLSGYQVKIPATWVVLHKEGAEPEGRSWANGFIGQGIGRGGNPFRYDALSSWHIGTTSLNDPERTDYDRWPPTADAIVSRRTFALANESIECTDHWSHETWGVSQSKAATIAQVSCSSNGRFHASFYGSRQQRSEFYGMLAQVKQVP